MLKKSPENPGGRTDGRTDRRTDGRTLPRHNTSRFSNGRIKSENFHTPPSYTPLDEYISIFVGGVTRVHSLTEKTEILLLAMKADRQVPVSYEDGNRT